MDNTIASSLSQLYLPTNATRSGFISINSDIPSNDSPPPRQSDSVSISPESISRNSQLEEEKVNTKPTENSVGDSAEISFAELQEIQKLQQRDAEVRAHEQAHLSTAGQYAAGGASFSYKTGPNGKRYATGGEVPIDLSKEKDPQATLAKMSQVQRAALAPAKPSAADRNIAARASMIAAQARSELNKNTGKEIDSETSTQSHIQDDSDAQSKSSLSSIKSRTFSNLENTIPSNIRRIALKAYAAHS